MKELKPIEEIRKNSSMKEIFKLMDMLNEKGITYEFYDHSSIFPRPIFKPFSFDVDHYEEMNNEHYQIIIRKENSLDRLISIIELNGYNDTLEIMSDYIYIKDEDDMVEQYLSAEEVFNSIINYYNKGGNK